MINNYCFTDRTLRVPFKINLGSHHSIHSNSKIPITPKHKETSKRYDNEVLKEMFTVFARLINHYKFKYHALFSARFYILDENDEASDEIELNIHLDFVQKLTRTGIDNIEIKSQLKHQFQNQEVKDCEWIFDKSISMKIKTFKTTELNRSFYVKIPLGSYAIFYFEDVDKYCFIWSILAHLQPMENAKTGHPTRVSTYGQ